MADDAGVRLSRGSRSGRAGSFQGVIAQPYRIALAEPGKLDYALCDGFRSYIGAICEIERLQRTFVGPRQDLDVGGLEYLIVRGPKPMIFKQPKNRHANLPMDLFCLWPQQGHCPVGGSSAVAQLRSERTN
jgi:hypothetical protein